MKRRSFILTMLAAYPMSLLAKINIPFMWESVKGFVVRKNDARTGVHLLMKGITKNNLDVKITSADSNGEAAVFEQTGHTLYGGPPLHIHLSQDEWFYIAEGEYFFQVGDDRYRLKPGDMIFLPRQIQHAFMQLTETARVIVTYMPAGDIENFFKDTSEWKSPPAKDEVARVFASHNMKVVGPPLRKEDIPEE